MGPQLKSMNSAFTYFLTTDKAIITKLGQNIKQNITAELTNFKFGAWIDHKGAKIRSSGCVN